MKLVVLFLSFSLLFSFASCGGGSSSSTSEKSSEQLRFINAIKSESAIDIQFGDDLFVEELAYGETSGFLEVPEGKVQLRVSSSERVVPILSAEQDIKSGSKQTFLLFDEESKIILQAVEEKPKKPLLGESSVRFINLSEDQTPVDIYIVFPNEDLKNKTVVVSQLAFKSLSNYISFQSGTFDIVYTEAETTKVLRRAEAINFSNGKIYTHVLLDRVGSERGQTSRLYEDSLF
jgi:hypothetical protein